MEKLPKELIEEYPYLEEWSILTAYRGSIAHGTYRPSTDPNSIDDKDIICIVIPPIEYYFGLQEFGSRGTKEIKYKEWDIVVYEIRKLVRMLEQGNPNVLSLLWTDKKHFLKTTKHSDFLISMRDHFVGKHIYKSFCGYAKSQMKKMTHTKFQGYMGEKRKQLVEKHGHDTKNGAHLIRLLRMCKEFLTNGKLFVERADAKELLDIKDGKWSLEKVVKEAERLHAIVFKLYSNSNLPERSNRRVMNNILTKIIGERFLLD